MCIEIGEGKVLLPTGIAIQANNITVKGAGMDKTVIKPEDPDGYLNNIKNGADSTIKYDAKRLFEVTGDNVTIADMTLDSRGIPSDDGIWILNKAIDFVPLRLTGHYTQQFRT